ncbi:MAG: tetratricopeptide repeat protein [Gemmatimonadetes bacterium]|nr:tetratricopeptide repeat protein [Gemmatimonadota bacterium]MDA1104431.1 tetratricopeptide repeat protein [Gemmatimonadota bacterium]
MRGVAAALIMLAAASSIPLRAQGIADARAALNVGEYEEAIDLYRDVLKDNPGAVAARVELMEALVATGAYAAAISTGREAPDERSVANALGEALVQVGRLDEAEQSFATAVAAAGAWGLTARFNLAELHFNRGRIEEAMEGFDRFIDVYNSADGRLSSRDLVAVARAVRYLGRNDPNLFRDALQALDQAATADPTWMTPIVYAGDLFLEKYDSPSAQTEFEKVLALNPHHPGALLGLAKALAFDGTSDSRRVLDRLLAVNPNHVEAHTLIAGQYLTNERHEDAREAADAALAINPESLLALTTLAGSHLLADDQAAFDIVRGRVLAINPRYAELDVALAELSVQTRRYQQAVDRAQAAVELDPAAWEAWGLLGMNQLRVGAIDAGRANIERAFAGDPFNPWFKNNLDLLDTFERFEIRPTEHFELFLHSTEAQLLANYLAPIAEEAFDSLSRRYGVEPDLPVRAELFPSHADFSVRTLGEAGLGALGVSFGRVLVMDSPSARSLGDYNWASVFWHELAHTFHLAMTDNRVPRWFSEGLAVHEQRKGREGWGHQPSIPFLQALQDGRLKKVSELNDGFMRPDYPQQVIFSYYQASLVFQVIEDRHGFDAVRQMLHGYGRGETTEHLFRTVLQTSAEDFDDEFADYLKERFRAPLAGLLQLENAPASGADVAALQNFARAHPGDLLTRLRLGVMLFRDGRGTDAEEQFEAALRIFPEYGGPDSPYWFLAQIHRERGELEAASAALARLNALSESNYAALLAHAEILAELGRPGESAEALDKAVQIWPYELSLHERLAALHAELGNREGAVRERSAVVALNPADRAEALFRLAVAHRDAGDTRSARLSVMGALEIAPNYEEALELLLELRGSTEEHRP